MLPFLSFEFSHFMLGSGGMGNGYQQVGAAPDQRVDQAGFASTGGGGHGVQCSGSCHDLILLQVLRAAQRSLNILYLFTHLLYQ